MSQACRAAACPFPGHQDGGWRCTPGPSSALVKGREPVACPGERLLPAGSSCFRPMCLLDQNHCLKGCLTFLFPVKEKGARGIIGGRRKVWPRSSAGSVHLARVQGAECIWSLGVTRRNTPHKDLKLKDGTCLMSIRPVTWHPQALEPGPATLFAGAHCETSM